MFSRFKNYVSQQVEVLKTGQPQPPPAKGEAEAGEKEATTKATAQASDPKEAPPAVASAPAAAVEGNRGTPPLEAAEAGAQLLQKKDPPQKSSSGALGLSTSLLSFFTVKKGFENAEYDIPEQYWKEGVEMNAGFSFIRRYEDAWNTLHEKNIDLGRSAERTDRQLKSAVQQANKHHTAISQLEKQLSQLPRLIERMNNAVVAVEAIEDHLKRLEDLYVTTVQKKKTQAFLTHQKKRKEELFQYEQSRRDELVKIDNKLRILRDHVRREEELELQRAEQEKKRLAAIAAQKEREEYEAGQAELQQKFLEDLEAFKSGALKERPVPPDGPSSITDVSIDDAANDDLMSFLGGDDDDDDEGNSADLTSMKLTEDDIGPTGVEVLPVVDEPAVEYVPLVDIVAGDVQVDEEQSAQETIAAMETDAESGAGPTAVVPADADDEPVVSATTEAVGEEDNLTPSEHTEGVVEESIEEVAPNAENEDNVQKTDVFAESDLVTNSEPIPMDEVTEQGMEEAAVDKVTDEAVVTKDEVEVEEPSAANEESQATETASETCQEDA